MYIRKKNNENSRIKRPAKRSKSCDMFFSSGCGYYLKPIAIFSAFLTLDFLMEIRLEYLWSCWLLFKSVTDSYKYQGLVFTLFFMLIVLTSDIICYLLIPVTWLFFLASSYVWVQLVGHTERGICLPTVGICLIFLYMEYMLRLHSFNHKSLGIDICRPFAAHGLGYPVVTMGFGLKSYVTYKFRMRKQRDVEAENRFFFQLIDQALPDGNRRFRVNTEAENETSSLGDESLENSSVETPPVASSNSCNSNLKTSKSVISNGKLENSHSSDLLICKPHTTSIDIVNQWALSSTQGKQSALPNGHVKQQKSVTNGSCVVESSNNRKVVNLTKQNNDISKMEVDLRKLRLEIQSSKNNELDLKSQISQISQSHQMVKIELSQCRQEAASIQNKLQSVQQKYQTEKQNNQVLEKKLTDEKKNSQILEQQLIVERKARKDESEIKSKVLQSATLAVSKSSECTESCKSKRRQLEQELKAVKREKQSHDEQIKVLEQQLTELPRLRKVAEEFQQLSVNITNLREEKDHLVRTLSEENKIKQSLITAYHSSLKEVNALNEQLTQKDYQILQLNMNGVSDYLTNHQSHFHHQSLHRQTPLTPSSSPLMDETNFFTNTNTSMMSPSSLYSNMMGGGSVGGVSSIVTTKSSSAGGSCSVNNNQNNVSLQSGQQTSSDFMNQQQSVVSSSVMTASYSTGGQPTCSSPGLIGGFNGISGVNQSSVSDKILESSQQPNISNCGW